MSASSLSTLSRAHLAAGAGANALAGMGSTGTSNIVSNSTNNIISIGINNNGGGGGEDVVVWIGGSSADAGAPPAFELRQVEAGIFRVRERFYEVEHKANMWVVLGRDMDLVVDSGLGLWDLHGFLTAHIKGFGCRPCTVVATNAHFDHSGGLHDLRAKGCVIAAHEAEVSALASGDNVSTCTCLSEQDIKRVRVTRPDWGTREYCVQPTEVTRILQDGDAIDLGDRRLHVLHLPGHSPGSIALLDKRNGILFSGDVVYDGTILDWLPGSNVSQRIISYKRLQELSSACLLRAVYPGHFDEFNGKRLIGLATDYLCRAGVGYRMIESCLSKLATLILHTKHNPITYYACCCCCKCFR